MSNRKQASGIPHLLVASKPPIGPQLPPDLHNNDDEATEHRDQASDYVDHGIYANGMGDARGYYQDGAYIGAPDEAKELEYFEDEGQISDGELECTEDAVHRAYFASVMNQYLQLRNLLHHTPSSDIAAKLHPYQLTDAAPFGHRSSTTSIWSRTLRISEPSSVQIALLSKDSVLRILRVLLGGKFLRRGYPLTERTSRWLWALLARLPDAGELTHVEISWIRDLGRRAVLLGRSLAEMAALRDELEDGGLGVHEGVDGSSSDEGAVSNEEGSEGEVASGSYSPDEVKRLEAESHPPDTIANQKSQHVDMTAESTDQPEQDKPPDAAAELSEEGEVEEEDDCNDDNIAMDMASTPSETGSANPPKLKDSPDEVDSLEHARQQLLDKLDNPDQGEEDSVGDDEEATIQRARSRINLRTTLNMILTVAGEFYGQRDLLEFREPFVGM